MPTIRQFLLWLSRHREDTEGPAGTARERILDELRMQEPMFYVDRNGQRWAAPGLFSRIARDHGVSTSYVSKVAASINVKGSVGRPRKAA